MLEVWKQIENFPYEISNYGRVKSNNITRTFNDYRKPTKIEKYFFNVVSRVHFR